MSMAESGFLVGGGGVRLKDEIENNINLRNTN